jgi:hypothetical protein
MYFIMKYIGSIFKYYHNSDKYLQKVIWHWSKGGKKNNLFTLVTIRESTLYFLKVNKLTRQKGGEKKSQAPWKVQDQDC